MSIIDKAEQYAEGDAINDEQYKTAKQAYLAGLHEGRSEVIDQWCKNNADYCIYLKEKDKQIEELKAQLNEERQLHKLFQPCV